MTDFNTHPQPRTFAPSKEDVLQNLQYFFGAPVSPEKLKDYSEHHAVTHHFPGLQPRTQPIATHSRARLQWLTVPARVCRRLRRPEHQDRRDPQQPDPQQPADVADLGALIVYTL